MKLESFFAKEIKKEANGDGSREHRVMFVRKAAAAARDLGNPGVIQDFGKILKKHGRIPVAICIAATASRNKNSVCRKLSEWSEEVLKLYTNRPSDLLRMVYNDGLHPSRMEQYTKMFVDNTISCE